MSRRALQLALLALLLGSAAQAAARPGRATPPGMPRSFQLHTLTVRGRQYYRTFRVTSPEGFKRITDTSNPYRFFRASGQYGEGYYLFRTRRDARRFVKCEQRRGAGQRNLIAEVLLPKSRLDRVVAREVKPRLDWAMLLRRGNSRREALRTLRLSSHLLFGRWAPSPMVQEPVYERMNGATQLAVVQLGRPSILNEAIIRLHERR
jgi:hypothetical protein